MLAGNQFYNLENTACLLGSPTQFIMTLDLVAIDRMESIVVNRSFIFWFCFVSVTLYSGPVERKLSGKVKQLGESIFLQVKIKV